MADIHPQVKICGLKDPETAAAAAALGADAIGCVFFEKSPRHVAGDAARAIRSAVPAPTKIIGVFVDRDYDGVMSVVDRCGLDGAQLHGRETPETVSRLCRQGLVVIKGLFTTRPPLIAEADAFEATAFLLECGKGPLPGGNAESWDWRGVAGFSARHPLVLAGGLDAGNVADAVAAAAPDAVDVSSGVEVRPGVKSLEKIAAFIAAVRRSAVPAARRGGMRKVF